MTRPQSFGESAWDSQGEDPRRGCPTVSPTGSRDRLLRSPSHCGSHVSQSSFQGREIISVNVDFGHTSNIPFQGEINREAFSLRLPHAPLSPRAQSLLPCPRRRWLRRPLSLTPYGAPVPVGRGLQGRLLTSHHSSHHWLQVTEPPSPPATSHLPLPALRVCEEAVEGSVTS